MRTERRTDGRGGGGYKTKLVVVLAILRRAAKNWRLYHLYIVILCHLRPSALFFAVEANSILCEFHGYTLCIYDAWINSKIGFFTRKQRKILHFSGRKSFFFWRG